MISARRLTFLILAALTILAPQETLARRSMTIRMPKFDVPPRGTREICTFVPLPARQPVNITYMMVDNLGWKLSFATHHVIVYAYTADLAPLTGMERRVVDDPVCINFGGGGPGKLQVAGARAGKEGAIPDTAWYRNPPDACHARKR